MSTQWHETLHSSRSGRGTEGQPGAAGQELHLSSTRAWLLIRDGINFPNVMERKEAERAALCVRDSPECELWTQREGEAVIPPGLAAMVCPNNAKDRLFPDSPGDKGRSRQLVELIFKQQEFSCPLHEENPLLHTTTAAEHLQTTGCRLNIGPWSL